MLANTVATGRRRRRSCSTATPAACGIDLSTQADDPLGAIEQLSRRLAIGRDHRARRGPLVPAGTGAIRRGAQEYLVKVGSPARSNASARRSFTRPSTTSADGLPNRRVLDGSASRSTARAGPTGRWRCCFLTWTTSRTSTIRSGQAPADRLLAELAERLRAMLRPMDGTRGIAATSSRCCSRTCPPNARSCGSPSGSAAPRRHRSGSTRARKIDHREHDPDGDASLDPARDGDPRGRRGHVPGPRSSGRSRYELFDDASRTGGGPARARIGPARGAVQRLQPRVHDQRGRPCRRGRLRGTGLRWGTRTAA